MNWRELCGEKLVTPERALQAIRSTDRVVTGGMQATPFTLCKTLLHKREEFRGLRVHAVISLFSWDLPGIEEFFQLETTYLSRRDRPLMNRGAMEYFPVSYFRAGVLPPGQEEIDVYMVTVSPPDCHGFCSFGTGVYMSPLMIRQARTVIAEVDKNFIRTGGQNSVHISEIDYFVERRESPPPPFMEEHSPEKKDAIAAIGTLIAAELIQDRDTIQIGAGDVTSSLPSFLTWKKDLGMHTEIIPPGAVTLVREGALTGTYKTIHPGKVVGSAFALGLSPEELDFIDGNPVFELYDFNYTDDIQVCARHPEFTAVNNALTIDLTGQVASESIGPAAFTGTGGQTAFTVAACLAGGKAIIALPSCAVVGGKPLSRIVPMFEPGTVVTVPRAFVHYVVTEYGIATLKGKSLRQRVNEMVAVAHPDFRVELQREARRLYFT